jgi:hypothetical protein
MTTPKLGKKIQSSGSKFEIIADQLDYEYADYDNGNTTKNAFAHSFP